MSSSDPLSRTELLIGKAGVARLQCARVAVFGLGAVGSYAVEALARAGVGFLRLVDFDTIRESNLNRQLYALQSTLGHTKVEVAAERIRQINRDCVIEERTEFIDSQIARVLLGGKLDAAIDAIDSLSPKVALIQTAFHMGVPLISCFGAASRTDPFAIRVGDISESANCPLGRRVRKRLHKEGILSGIRCIYSVEPAADWAVGPEPESDALERGRQRRPVGSISFITGMFGLHAACETVRLILGGTIRPIDPPTAEPPGADETPDTGD